jgi:POT family proton-dependent oligopeptide transporter
MANKTRLDKTDWLHIILISGGMIPLVLALLALWRIGGPIWHGLPTPVQVGLVLTLFIALWNSHSLAKPVAERAPLNRGDWQRIAAILLIGIFVVLCWLSYDLASGTVSQFAQVHTDRMIPGMELPAQMFQVIDPIALLLLGMPLGFLWLRNGQSRFALAAPVKMAMGMIILGLGFVVLAIAQSRFESIGKVSPLWLLAIYLLHTIGELCLTPIGLALVTKLAPARVMGVTLVLWSLTNFAANKLADAMQTLVYRSDFPLYGFLICASIGAGLVLLALIPLLKKLTHGKL